MLARDPRAEILAEGNARADPRAIQEEPSAAPAIPAAAVPIGVKIEDSRSFGRFHDASQALFGVFRERTGRAAVRTEMFGAMATVTSTRKRSPPGCTLSEKTIA